MLEITFARPDKKNAFHVAETAKLSAPFVNLGLAPETSPSMLLPARIGRVHAFAMFALGESHFRS